MFSCWSQTCAACCKFGLSFFRRVGLSTRFFRSWPSFVRWCCWICEIYTCESCFCPGTGCKLNPEELSLSWAPVTLISEFWGSDQLVKQLCCWYTLCVPLSPKHCDHFHWVNRFWNVRQPYSRSNSRVIAALHKGRDANVTAPLPVLSICQRVASKLSVLVSVSIMTWTSGS